MDRSSDQPCQAFWGNPTRRQLLQVGGLGVLGLTLPRLLSARAPSPRSGSTRGRARACIFVVQYGGASHIDTWDVKPAAPNDIRGPYRPIATSVPGIQITERCPRQARVMHQFSIVRSVNHQNSIHSPSCHWMQTGYFGPTTARNARNSTA